MWPKQNKWASIGAWKRDRTRKSNIASLSFLCWVLIHLTIRESPPTFICISFYFHKISKSLWTSLLKVKMRIIWSGSKTAVLAISLQIHFNLLCYIIPPTNLKLVIFIPRVQGDNVIFLEILNIFWVYFILKSETLIWLWNDYLGILRNCVHFPWKKNFFQPQVYHSMGLVLIRIFFFAS